MNINNMKNMIVLKDLPSNIVDEAIVILKPNVKLKKLDILDNNRTKKSNKEDKNNKQYIINEAEMVISNYLSKVEGEKRDIYKANNKIERKYKKVKSMAILFGILFLISCLI